MDVQKRIVISLGGSIVVPNLPDSDYIKELVSLVNDCVTRGYKFLIIVGGGKTCRNYQDALKQVREVSNEDLDWLGIYSTVFNAEFIRLAFGDATHGEVICDRTHLANIDADIIIGAGWRPGSSTDLAAVQAADIIGAASVVNLSNIDYVYDKDPRKFSDATPIHKTNWSDFRAILPTEWDPGLNAPFDPIAAKKAEELGIEVAIMNGKDLENLKKYLAGEEFIGTKITN